MTMKKKLTAALLTTLLAAACTTEPQKGETAAGIPDRLPGDSTVYGLACDGCTDTLLIILTDINADPDTFNILEASSRRQIFGRPQIGDEMALVRNAADSMTADMAINLKRLKDTWCYMEQPKLRERAGVTDEMRRQMESRMPDSVMQRIMAPREFGLQFRSNHSVHTIGLQGVNAEKNSPVTYAVPHRYNEWHLMNGRLLLSEVRRDSVGNRTVLHTDTVDLTLMRRDSLVLRFKDKEQGYYRRK